MEYHPYSENQQLADREVHNNRLSSLLTPPVRHALKNSGWLLFSQGLAVAAATAATVVMIRVLGPGPFGVLNVAVGLVALALPVVDLGFRPLLIRELSRDVTRGRSLLFSAAVAQLAAAVLMIVLVLLAGAYFYGIWSPSWPLLLVLVWLLPLEVCGVFIGWFDSRGEGRALVRGEIAGTAVVTAGRLAAAFLYPQLWLFALIMVAAATTRGLIWVVIARKRLPQDRVQIIPAKQVLPLLNDAWPFLVNSVGIFVFLKADVVMLGAMRSKVEVGHYSAGVLFFDLMLIVPVLVIRSVTPALLDLYSSNPQRYRQRLQLYYDAMTWAAIAAAIGLAIVAPFMIPLVLGDKFAPAVPALRILALAFPIVVQGTMTDPWMLSENKQRLLMPAIVTAAVANILLNLSLIPSYGILGAAWASVLSYSVAAYVGRLPFAGLRPCVRQQCYAVMAPLRWIRQSTLSSRK